MDVVASFPPENTSAASARAFVGGALENGHEDTRDVAVLLTSELAANAVLHARTDFEVRVSVASERIRIEVLDENPRTPVAGAVPVDAASGRGLILLEQLATSWGVDRSEMGKIVWFEIAVGSS